MNCLDGQIGVVGLAGYDSAKSGLYINDLPGLTLNQLDKIKDDTEDYQDAASAWERIYKRAKKNLEFDVIGANRRHFKRTSIITSRITGQITSTILTSQGVRTGHYYDFSNYSKSLEIFFNSAQLFMDNPGTVTVEVYDATMGVQLTSFSGTAITEGVLNIAMQEGFSMLEYPKLFICYDDTAVDVHKVDDYWFTDFQIDNTMQVSTGGAVLYSNLSAASTGLILNYNVKCGVVNWMCQNIDVFVKPFWYKLGVEWLNERFGSDRFNRYTMIDTEKAQALRDDFEMEYKQSLDDILQTMHPTPDGYCFECSKQMNQRFMMA